MGKSEKEILEALKKEAKKYGYHLVKDCKPENMLNCPVCGTKRTTTFYSPSGQFKECNHCGFRGMYAKNSTELNAMWNLAVIAYLDQFKRVVSLPQIPYKEENNGIE